MCLYTDVRSEYQNVPLDDRFAEEKSSTAATWWYYFLTLYNKLKVFESQFLYNLLLPCCMVTWHAYKYTCTFYYVYMHEQCQQINPKLSPYPGFSVYNIPVWTIRKYQILNTYKHSVKSCLVATFKFKDSTFLLGSLITSTISRGGF